MMIRSVLTLKTEKDKIGEKTKKQREKLTKNGRTKEKREENKQEKEE